MQLDWPRRLKRMRVHTALHLLSVVLPYPVTGGSIGDGDGRLDFDIPDAGLDKASDHGQAERPRSRGMRRSPSAGSPMRSSMPIPDS